MKFSDANLAVDVPAKCAVSSGGISFTSIFGNTSNCVNMAAPSSETKRECEVTEEKECLEINIKNYKKNFLIYIL